MDYFPGTFLQRFAGRCGRGNNIILTYDNDFNVAEAASIPANPQKHGPFVQLELLGANYPRIYVIGR